jgi:hypothetical protein
MLTLAVGILAGADPLAAEASDPSLLFNGTTLQAWALNQSAAADRITQLNGFAGHRGPVLRLTAYDGDVAPATPTDNPRAQLVGPSSIEDGDVLWESWEMRLPRSFPSLLTTQWLGLWTAAYGPPFDGTPPIGLGIFGSRLGLSQDGYAPVPWHQLWSIPIPRDRWARITVHFDFASEGWVEFFFQDQPQELREDGQVAYRAPMAFIDPTNDGGPNSARIFVYFESGAAQEVTAYFADFRIGLTRAAVEPGWRSRVRAEALARTALTLGGPRAIFR